MPALKALLGLRRSLRWFDCLAVAAFLWGLYCATVPGMNPLTGLFSNEYHGAFGYLLGLVLSLTILPPWSLWWLVGVGWLFRAANLPSPWGRSSPAQPWHWWLSPFLALAFWGMLLTDLPLRLAFPLHRSALARLVAEADRTPAGGEPAARRVGLYPVKGVFESINAPKKEKPPSGRRHVVVEPLGALAPYEAGGFVYDPDQPVKRGRFFPAPHAVPALKGRLDWMYMHTIPLGRGWYAYVLFDDD
jgi:hypothetical protein